MLQKIQQAVGFELWVAVPQCAFDSCAVPGTLKWGIERVSSKLLKLGVQASVRFYGGHSLGGAMIPDYVSAYDPAAAGMVLMGSFLTHKWKTGATAEGTPQVVFPVPTLTVGGELDGLCRITRIAEAAYSQIDLAADPQQAAVTMPVTVIAGLNHMFFASGAPSNFVQQFDLRSELTGNVAHLAVAGDSALFLNSRALFSADASYNSKLLRQRVQESRVFLSPIIDALLLEAFAAFLPPCYCEATDEYGYMQYGTCQSSSACYGGVPWTQQYAQPIMAGASSSMCLYAHGYVLMLYIYIYIYDMCPHIFPHAVYYMLYVMCYMSMCYALLCYMQFVHTYAISHVLFVHNLVYWVVYPYAVCYIQYSVCPCAPFTCALSPSPSFRRVGCQGGGGSVTGGGGQHAPGHGGAAVLPPAAHTRQSRERSHPWSGGLSPALQLARWLRAERDHRLAARVCGGHRGGCLEIALRLRLVRYALYPLCYVPCAIC
ncbi:hypothetical protein EON64_07390, partial [archaeon]